MMGTELVYSAPLAHPSHLGGSPLSVPWHGGALRSIAVGDVRRWGKMTREGDFCVYLLAEVGGVLYAIDGKGRSDDEEKVIRRRCRRFKVTCPSGRGWGFSIAMEDGAPAPNLRTMNPGELSPLVVAAESRR